MNLKTDGFFPSGRSSIPLPQQARQLCPAPWDHLATGEQVHGSHIEHVERFPSPLFHRYPATDGLSTRLPSTALGILTADCTAVAILDADTPALGMAHAGWRGTYGMILPSLVSAMAKQYGTRPSSCYAVLGPAVGGACYEISLSLAEMFRTQFPSSGACFSTGPSGTPRLDLRKLQRLQLLDAGLPPQRIQVSDACTHCDTARYYSYRRDGQLAGRHLTIAVRL